MEDLPVWLIPLVGYVLGAVGRVLWPYLTAYLKDGVKFDPKYVTGQLLGALGGLVPVLALSGFIDQLPALGFLGAMWLGYGASDAGREAQKMLTVLRGRGS